MRALRFSFWLEKLQCGMLSADFGNKLHALKPILQGSYVPGKVLEF
jgi:hypothetical protein